MAEMAARAALREGRGAAAKAREASERRLVGEVASHQMVEQLLLERWPYTRTLYPIPHTLPLPYP